MSNTRESTPVAAPSRPWAREVGDLLEALDVDPDQGLTEDAVRRRRRRHGPNRIERQQRTRAFTVLVNQFRSVIVIVLGAAAVVTFAFRQWAEGVAISAVVVVNALIGFVTELRAVRAMEALEKLSQSQTRVRRGGRVRTVASHQLVPGDVVVLEAGDTVAADLRVLESARLQADESTLTGESQPVTKQLPPVGDDAPLAERRSLLFKGTAITSGSGQGLVVATGMNTELGAISRDIREAEAETTPLEERLDQLGRAFIWLTVALSAVVVLVGWLQSRDLLLVVEAGVALAVAAIPEGLPIVATIALARGMRRMAAQNALVNRLSAVETLGGATIIATDKTGTLTENRMTVVRLTLPDDDLAVGGRGHELSGDFRRRNDDGDDGGGGTVDPADHGPLREALTVGALCTNAELHGGDDGEAETVGDPMEVALLVAAHKAGLERDDLLERRPERREVAFDPDRKLMATIHDDDDGLLAAVKGAPEAVLAVCAEERRGDRTEPLDDEARERRTARARELAEEGLRVLALARGRVDDPEADPYRDLLFLGLVGLVDPPRREVADTIATAQRAGIRTVMVTGDQAATARAVAEALDLGDDGAEALEGRALQEIGQRDEELRRRVLDGTIFARVSPRQKLDLVGLLQEEGHVVAMTGDGVNDAPALEKADIGVAMGKRGTQVAREAADIILKDDDFGTLVAAIREGRIIFGNLRQFVLFLLSVSLSMILAVFCGSVAGLPMPVLPLQILFLNAVTHVFPALALGLGEGQPGVMDHAPRDPEQPILQRSHWLFVWAHAVLITVVALAGLVLADRWLGLPAPQAQTVAFLTIALAQLWHVFNVRARDSGLVINEVTRNAYVWLAVVLSLALTLAIVYVGPVADVMRVTPPPFDGWALAAGLSVSTVVVSWGYAAWFGGARIVTADERSPGG